MERQKAKIKKKKIKNKRKSKKKVPQKCELRSLASLFVILLSIATGEEQTQSSVVDGPGSSPHMGFESASDNNAIAKTSHVRG